MMTWIMARRRLSCVVEILIGTVVFLLPLKISGLIEPPSGVTVKAIHGSDFLIISWNYQADVSLYRIVFSNPPDEAGPMSPYCLPDNTTCSYCVSNMNRPHVSCSTLDGHYTGSIGRKLDFEKLVSVRIEACTDIFPEYCVEKSKWKNYTIPPGAPNPVTNVHAWPLSSKTVEVTWSAPNQTRGTIVLYSVLYKTDEGRKMKRVFKNKTKGIITRLYAKTTYKIWVTASTSQKEGERSQLITVKTYADECESSPCKNSGKCHLDGGSYTCDCQGDWEGHSCDNPKGFALNKNKCLDVESDRNASVYINVSLGFCAEQCRGVSSCKSFEYGLGYSSGGTFVDTLHQRSLGFCKLRRTDTSLHTLKPCYQDYYEKKPPVSAGSDASLFNVMVTGSFVLLSFMHAMLTF